MIEDSKILLLWGVTTFIGWITTAVGFYLPLRPQTVLFAWAVLMAVPVILTVYNYYSENSNRLFNFWTLIVTALTAENLFVGRYLVFSYFGLWMLVGAAGYYFTSAKMPPPSGRTYLYGAVLNLAAIPLVYLVPLQYFSLIAALVQTAPIFYDYQEVH